MALGTAVIVGFGPGLGLALARTFADAGHPVAMLALDKAKLETYVAEVASAGQDVRGYVADAADPANLRAALHSAIIELGTPDVLSPARPGAEAVSAPIPLRGILVRQLIR